MDDTKILGDINPDPKRARAGSVLEDRDEVGEARDGEEELASTGETVDLSALEADFVKAARDYGTRKGISYAAWREAGVDAAVLKRAGISRSS